MVKRSWTSRFILVSGGIISQPHWGLNKMADMFKLNFVEWKFIYFDLSFTEIYSRGSNPTGDKTSLEPLMTTIEPKHLQTEEFCDAKVFRDSAPNSFTSHYNTIQYKVLPGTSTNITTITVEFRTDGTRYITVI